MEVVEHAVEKLINAILLSALKKRATRIVIAYQRVSFEVGGVLTEEMRPPANLHRPMLERVGAMASLPAYGRGQRAVGQLTIRIGAAREETFAVEVSGEGNAAFAELRVPG